MQITATACKKDLEKTEEDDKMRKRLQLCEIMRPTKTDRVISMTTNKELIAFQKKVKEVHELGLRSKSSSLQRLVPEIDKLTEAGYTHERICEVMTAEGLELNVGTFRTLMSRIKTRVKPQ